MMFTMILTQTYPCPSSSSFVVVNVLSPLQWTANSLHPNNRSKRSLLESFANFDSSEDPPVSTHSDTPADGTSQDIVRDKVRVPTHYYLRVISHNGALIREKIEIEGSRVVMLASVGTICIAYERSCTAAGIIRYKTKQGWLSEYRRDHLKEPIVEVIGVSYHALHSQEEKTEREILMEKSKNIKFKRLCEGLTLQESVCTAMSRVNNSLRQFNITLSRNISQDQSSRRVSYRSTELSPCASVLSTYLSKSLKGFVESPFPSLDGSSQTDDLPLIADGVLIMRSTERPTYNNGKDNYGSYKDGGSSSKKTPSKKQSDNEFWKRPKPSDFFHNSNNSNSSGKGGKKGKLSRSDFNNEKEADPDMSPHGSLINSNMKKDGDGDASNQESTCIDVATMCLYQGVVVKVRLHISSPPSLFFQ